MLAARSLSFSLLNSHSGSTPLDKISAYPSHTHHNHSLTHTPIMPQATSLILFARAFSQTPAGCLIKYTIRTVIQKMVIYQTTPLQRTMSVSNKINIMLDYSSECCQSQTSRPYVLYIFSHSSYRWRSFIINTSFVFSRVLGSFTQRNSSSGHIVIP